MGMHKLILERLMQRLLSCIFKILTTFVCLALLTTWAMMVSSSSVRLFTKSFVNKRKQGRENSPFHLSSKQWAAIMLYQDKNVLELSLTRCTTRVWDYRTSIAACNRAQNWAALRSHTAHARPRARGGVQRAFGRPPISRPVHGPARTGANWRLWISFLSFVDRTISTPYLLSSWQVASTAWSTFFNFFYIDDSQVVPEVAGPTSTATYVSLYAVFC